MSHLAIWGLEMGSELCRGVWINKADSAGNVYAKISFLNTSEKTMKYIYFTLVPYNKVCDELTPKLIVQFVGPLNPDEKVKEYISNNFLLDNRTNPIIAFIALENVVIEYMDGSKETLERHQVERLERDPDEDYLYENSEADEMSDDDSYEINDTIENADKGKKDLGYTWTTVAVIAVLTIVFWEWGGFFWTILSIIFGIATLSCAYALIKNQSKE